MRRTIKRLLSLSEQQRRMVLIIVVAVEREVVLYLRSKNDRTC